MKSQVKSISISLGKILLGMVAGVCILSIVAFKNVELTQSDTSKEKSEKVRGKIYEQVEQMPEYPGGEIEMRKFLANSVKYPVEAQQKGIQGKVFVSFVVDKKGAVKNVKIARGADPLLDAEALRVVNNFPQWIPGKEKGKKVAVQYTVPINFRLE
jgi:protein TonB